MSKESKNKNLKVFYDNDCPVCSRFIVSVNGSSKKENFECKPMQNIDSNDMLSQEFHVITQDGNIYRKFDGILKIGEMYPKWRSLIKIARLPVLYPILSFGYDVFATHRYGISKLFNRFLLVKITLLVAMIFGLLLSPKLWLSSRLYPQVTVLPLFPVIPYPFDSLIFALLLILLLISLWRKYSRKYVLGFIVLSAVLLFLDQSRLQPWFYQYLLMLSALSLYPWNAHHKKDQTIMLNICCFIIASIYFYSGLQKINVVFVTSVFPWLLEPIIHFFPSVVRIHVQSIGLLIPLVEMSIGIGLLTRRFQSFAILAAIGMHLSILLLLGPFGHNWNSVVWPWNIAMCCLVFLLFRQNQTFRLSSFLSTRSPFSLFVFLLFGILPLLSLFNLWDSYLSSSLYSGKIKNAQLYIRNSALNDGLQKYAVRTTGKYAIVDINAWSFSELHVPAYPESRIFKSITRQLCRRASSPSDIMLRIEEKPMWNTGKVTDTVYACTSL